MTIRKFVFMLLAGVPVLALAHTGNDGAHVHSACEALAAGFMHPFTGLDHMAAMVAVGVWSALTSRRLWLAPLAFASTLLAGALLGLAGATLPAVEPMIAASLLVLGLLVATRVHLPAAAAAALVAVFALFHGVAHGQELGGPLALFSIGGMVAATALLHAAGIALGRAVRDRTVWLPRVGGAAVALFGIGLLIT